MSLLLIEGYSSQEEEDQVEEEEEEEEPNHHFNSHHSSDDVNHHHRDFYATPSYKSVFDHSVATSASDLPSAFDVFSQISGPPEFLNNCVEEHTTSSLDGQEKHGRRRYSREKKDLPVGAVMEAKPQLVGIHERVRSDIESNQHATSSVSTTPDGAKRVPTATNPNAEDAAELLRMCLQCGVPKTYINERGMVCPVCGDRPRNETTSKDLKNKGSAGIKDKEKSKRMKGQSSHATWKSETEMQLRQQFD